MTAPTGPVLVGYDGSPNAREAVEVAGGLFRGAPAVVATAWLSFEEAAPAALLALPVEGAVEDLDATQRETAEAIAAEGAERARTAGLDAEPRTPHCRGPFFSSLVGLAEELDARAIVVGSRGRSSLAAAVLGSVSTGVLHHTTRPVLVVRGPETGDGS